MSGIIDEEGFRLNVGIIIASDDGRLFWGRRLGPADAWQFPQGGMQEGETPEQALFRELEEEVGLTEKDVEVVAVTKGWLCYRLPRRFLRRDRYRVNRCIGQRQKWFLLKLVTDESRIDLLRTGHPEFQSWRWVNYWYPIRKVVAFKRGVYVRALKELSPAFKTLKSGGHA
jgi:putative (di)nucleoside polyphosphate hydrolase